MSGAYSKVTQNVASRAQGVHGTGARSYKPEMADRILAILLSECVGPEHAITVEAMATRVGLNGRAVRQVVGDLELSKRVLCGYGGRDRPGWFVCRSAADGESLTRRYESQITAMQKRVTARRAMAASIGLPGAAQSAA